MAARHGFDAGAVDFGEEGRADEAKHHRSRPEARDLGGEDQGHAIIGPEDQNDFRRDAEEQDIAAGDASEDGALGDAGGADESATENRDERADQRDGECDQGAVEKRAAIAQDEAEIEAHAIPRFSLFSAA